ncbi:MAG: phosphatidate cytidylyltransferase [Bacillota bacterium]
MKERVITGLILAVVLIPLLFVPKIYFYAFIAVLIGLSARELVNMMVVHPSTRLWALLYTGGFALLIYLSLLTAYTGHLDVAWVFALLIGSLLVGIVGVVFNVFSYESFTRLFLSVQYISITFFAVSLLRANGLNMLVYLLILSMFTDIFAYFVGMKFGHTKLAPLISPKKTVEGFIGGTLIAAIVASGFAYAVGLFTFTGPMATLFAFLIGWLVAMSAQVGDLFASSMKRHFDIKDFSSLLPGHGGVLDRLDSTLFAALVLALALFIYGGI